VHQGSLSLIPKQRFIDESPQVFELNRHLQKKFAQTQLSTDPSPVLQQPLAHPKKQPPPLSLHPSPSNNQSNHHQQQYKFHHHSGTVLGSPTTCTPSTSRSAEKSKGGKKKNPQKEREKGARAKERRRKEKQIMELAEPGSTVPPTSPASFVVLGGGAIHSF